MGNALELSPSRPKQKTVGHSPQRNTQQEMTQVCQRGGTTNALVADKSTVKIQNGRHFSISGVFLPFFGVMLLCSSL
jgi:hypothetical protein